MTFPNEIGTIVLDCRPYRGRITGREAGVDDSRTTLFDAQKLRNACEWAGAGSTCRTSYFLSARC